MFIEKYAFVITILFVIWSLFVLSLFIYKEIMIQKRNNICFSNYESKSKYYNLRPSKIIWMNIEYYLLLSIVFSVYISFNNVTRIYLIVNIPLTIMMIVFLINEVRIKRTNRDLKEFDEFYNKVKKSENIKHDIEVSIKTFDKKMNELVKINNDLVNKYNQEVKISMHKNINENNINKISLFIDEYRNKLNSYDNNIINQFNFSIQEYLLQNKTNINNVITLDMPDKEKFNNLIDVAYKNIYSTVYDNTKIAISNGYVNNCSSLINLYELNKSIGNSLNELVCESIDFASKQKDKELLIKYFISNKLVDINHYLDIVNKKDYSWMYNRTVLEYFNDLLLSKIMLSIINENAKDCALNCLLNIPSDKNDLVKKTFENASVSNEAKEVFDIFISLFKISGGFNNETNMYENMALALQGYYFNNYSKLNKFNQIISTGSFINEGQFIEIEYKEVLDKNNVIYTSFINSLILYEKSVCKNFIYFDLEKIVSLFMEYKSNLNIKGMEILSLLLMSIVLIEDNDKALIDGVYSLIKNSFNKYNIGNLCLISSKHLNDGREIIRYLNKNYNNDLRRILYRVEKDRLSYDSIVNL